jgi:hypothetical protein
MSSRNKRLNKSKVPSHRGESKAEHTRRTSERGAGVKLEGPIAIEMGFGLKQEQRSVQQAQARQAKGQLLWAKTAALIGLLSTIVLAYQIVPSRQLARISERSADLTNRPYIGLSGIAVYVDPLRRTISFNAVAKNFGTTPGTQFDYEWVITSNGSRLQGKGGKTMSDTLFPGQTAVLVASVRDPAYDGVLTGKDVVEFQVTSRYTGPSGRYIECQRSRFVPEYRAVENRGPCEGG